MKPYGDAGKAYINWCANMAQSLKIGVPWIMCQQSDAPEPMVMYFSSFDFTSLKEIHLVLSIKIIIVIWD